MNHSAVAGTTIHRAEILCCMMCGAVSDAHHDLGALFGDKRWTIGVHHTLPSAGGVHDSFEPITIQPRNSANPSQRCCRHAGLPGRSTNSAPRAATVINVAPMYVWTTSS